ncbi:TRAP transporter small permease subunit [Shewanella gelidii]|nr:TRAP transporter small permease subunit [Shewanella gelidii]MCL1097280.1 TRAP transporter small permease subunit [Shewanella gelidii]
MQSVADQLEKIIRFTAAICCWSSAFLIFVIILNVTMRYGFSKGLILFEEIQWHLYAIGIMFGMSYAEITNSQVRVDVVADHLKPRTRLFWEMFGSVVFVLPMVGVILLNSWEYVASSFLLSETSESPLGLPFRWLIKSAIPISFILLALASISRLLRNLVTFFAKEEK